MASGGISTPSIPIVIRGGSHPSSQTSEGEAQFVRRLAVRPGQDDGIEVMFNFTTLATALDADREALATDLRQWLSTPATVGTPTEEEMIVCLSDDNQTDYYAGFRGMFRLDAEGHSVPVGDVTPQDPSEAGRDSTENPEDENADWYASRVAALTYYFTCDTVKTAGLTLRIENHESTYKEGDECHAEFMLNYQGRSVTFDITVLISDEERGEGIALSTLEKVGEEVLDADIVFDDSQWAKWFTYGTSVPINAEAVRRAFGDEVSTSDLGLYVMTDFRTQMLTDYFSYHSTFVTLDIEGKETSDLSAGLYYGLKYNPETAAFDIQYKPTSFSGGEVGSGSVFLVSGTKYVEYVLDLHFGYVAEALTDFEVLETTDIDVRLMNTKTNYTYMMDVDTAYVYSLASTAIDMSHISQLLGTESPALYAELSDADGVTYTRNYTADPGKGFWLRAEDEDAYVAGSEAEGNIGVYLSDGELRWYESPENIATGDVFKTHLYLVNERKGISVKLNLTISITDDADGITTYAVRRLPLGMSQAEGGTTAVELATFFIPQSTIYNIQGQRISTPVRGMNIMDGKKVWISR